ncbi:linear amide C-N hydrolase [uncultured Methanobrevibacter sp.]
MLKRDESIGLPCDLSYSSRFVKVAFICTNSPSHIDVVDSISQFFHNL